MQAKGPFPGDRYGVLSTRGDYEKYQNSGTADGRSSPTGGQQAIESAEEGGAGAVYDARKRGAVYGFAVLKENRSCSPPGCRGWCRITDGCFYQRMGKGRRDR